jgi:hypothetical protein
MVVENLMTFVVADYDALWKLYKNERLGKIEQRLPENLKKMKVGKHGTDEELIISLLNMDDDNVYHVVKIEGGFRITILAFSINVEILETTEKVDIYINYGEDGVWKEVLYQGDEQYSDAYNSTNIEVYSGHEELKKHKVKISK